MLALWLIAQLVAHTDPDVTRNVAFMLTLIFLASGSFISLLSWGIIRRFWRQDRFLTALRHGAWGGIVVVMLPLLRWYQALSPLVIGAVLLIIFGLESLILIQREQKVAE